MSETPAVDNDFSTRLTAIIRSNLGDEQFGVSELAAEMNMSRSNLLRKVKKETGLSVSQLISQARLKRAMELLRQSKLNVSEVSHEVGFNSTSYFIKCFREFYGYPPGEAGKHPVAAAEPQKNHTGTSKEAPPDGGAIPSRRRWAIPLGIAGLVVVLLVAYLLSTSGPGGQSGEKSIAILPFKNDSNDSSNVYLMNGLMESTLNNLQSISDLRVVSRTSAEKYRNTAKSMPEVASELNVRYLIEGSGQKMGDQILLNIQLIDGASDKHLWSRQYRRNTEKIFELQQEIAKDIAGEIRVIVTPEEAKRIAKVPTQNAEAYDYFLRAKDLFYKSDGESMRASLPLFHKAVALDNGFALAYANMTMVYYYLDIFQSDKKFGTEISTFSDKAWLHDPTLGESLVAKALYYIHKDEYEAAVPYLEKALEYNPTSGLVIDFLSEFYNMRMPHTGKYLEYALRGVQLDVGSPDSATTSFKYLQSSNALFQSGFYDEALMHADKSLAYNPRNPYSGYLRIYIRFMKHRDLAKTKREMLEILSQDSSRLDVLQEVGKVCYFMRDFKEATEYYQEFLKLRETYQLNIFIHENLTMAVAFREVGKHEEAERLVAEYKVFADESRTRYKHIHLAMYYIYRNDIKKALDHLNLFSNQDNFSALTLLLPEDPIVDNFKDHPEFKKIMKKIEDQFWSDHRRLKERLGEKKLL